MCTKTLTTYKQCPCHKTIITECPTFKSLQAHVLKHENCPVKRTHHSLKHSLHHTAHSLHHQAQSIREHAHSLDHHSLNHHSLMHYWHHSPEPDGEPASERRPILKVDSDSDSDLDNLPDPKDCPDLKTEIDVSDGCCEMAPEERCPYIPRDGEGSGKVAWNFFDSLLNSAPESEDGETPGVFDS